MKNSLNFLGTVRIVIVNFTKGNSLFNDGMQPSFWSKQAHQLEDEDWFQAGTNVHYEDSSYTAEINHLNPYKNRNY
jgi:hypothetical protein